jgi:LDH2 family malate/lactate/ureidoglycolate dehydrogenase
MYAQRMKERGMHSPTRIEILDDGGALLRLDGNNGVGQVVAQRSMKLAIDRAKSHGLSFVTVRNSNHMGALAPYALLAADAGCIGIVFTNASPRIAPSGGAQAMLGNNPWSIAVPTSSKPIVMDMANSVAALGKVRILKARGELLPEGWARDNDGMPTRDPDAAITGLLEPIAGHKGYVIALMIELLTGALSGGGGSYTVAAVTKSSVPGNVSHSFIAISLDHLGDSEELIGNIEKLAHDVKESRLARESTGIFIPGEIEARMQEDRTRRGIPLKPELASNLRDAASLVGISIPDWLG